MRDDWEKVDGDDLTFLMKIQKICFVVTMVSKFYSIFSLINLSNICISSLFSSFSGTLKIQEMRLFLTLREGMSKQLKRNCSQLSTFNFEEIRS
jgi:hypothetical protein